MTDFPNNLLRLSSLCFLAISTFKISIQTSLHCMLHPGMNIANCITYCNSHLERSQWRNYTRAYPGVSRFASCGSMDITDCHYIIDFARDEVVPDQTPVMVRWLYSREKKDREILTGTSYRLNLSYSRSWWSNHALV